VAAYDYRCRTCDTTFEVRRAVTDEATAVTCPAGHGDVARVWSAISVGGLAGAPAMAPAGGGGCCGGSCCS
jgi:putative FmdB family regulatory protein